MARITIHPSVVLDVTDVDFSTLLYGEDYSTSSSRFTAYFGNGFRDTFTGSGFRYNSYDVPYAGTVTSFGWYHGSQRLVLIEGFSIPATDFVNAAYTYRGDDDRAILARMLGGNDIVSLGEFSDYVRGFSGNDSIIGNGGWDTLMGDWGRDTLQGGAGNDLLMGGADADLLLGGEGVDTLSGDIGADRLFGGGGSDHLVGAGGVDFLNGDAGNDRLAGGEANDTMIGGQGNDTLSGDAGNDLLRGGTEADSLLGGVGADTLYGDAGADILVGSAGGDRLWGGVGADRFVFLNVNDSAPVPGMQDVILDFSRSQGDKLVLSAIDAKTDRFGNDAFHFIGDGRFTGEAGELRVIRQPNGVSVVQADTNGDGHPDLAFNVIGATNLVASDFVL
ncbi:calcium-binding protein [Paracoccus sp. KR1-242]|uniref:calcium-binding protein n=1 Tax=Paracoccus sp. KR1-242 TaxID=3410028 RepID=UPI003C05EC96